MDAATRAGMTGTEGAFVKLGAGVRAVFDKLLPFLKDAGGAIRTLVTGDFDPSQWGHQIDEDSPIVGALLTIREKIQDAVAFVRTVISGNFDPSQWGSPITEDSPIVAAALTIREKLQDLRGFIQTLITGDFNPANWSAGTTEDSPIVDKVLTIRETLQDLRGFIQTLITGDFNPANWSAGVEEDSPIVDKVLTIREKISGVVEWIKGAFSGLTGIIAGAYQSASGGDSAQFWSSVEQAGSTTSDLVKGIYGIAQALPSMSDVLKIAGGLFKFLADHMDTIIKWLPLLVAGFIAYKVAQSAVNIVNLANIPISILQIGATLASASANRALAIALGGTYRGTISQTLANVKSAAMWVWNTAALIAHKVATLAVSAATKAWTAVQWLFNAAMDANPIMIAVIAIAALVAGIIWAWNNVDWFKEAVIAAWTWIQNAALWAWDNVLKPVFDGIMVAVHAVGDFFTWLWENAIQPAFSAIGTAISWAWTTIIQPIFGFVMTIVAAVGAVFSWLWENIISPVFNFIIALISVWWNYWILPIFNLVIGIVKVVAGIFLWLWENAVQPAISWIGDKINWVWNSIVSPVFGWISDAISTLGGVFSWLYDNIVKPVFDAIGTAITWAWENVISPAFDLLMDGLGSVGEFFSTVASAIGTAWSNIKKWAAIPINWVIDTIWNHGIVPMWNTITGWIPGVDISLGELSLITVDESNPTTAPTKIARGGRIAVAHGGVLPGYGHSDIYDAKLSGGEGILNPEAVRGLGPDFVHSANRLFGGSRVAGGYGGSRVGGDGVGHFFLGGLWDGISNVAGGIASFVGDVVGGIVDLASFTGSFVTDPFGTIMGLLGHGDEMSATSADSSWGKMLMQLPGNIVGGIISAVKRALGFADDGTGGPPPVATISGGLNPSQDPSTFGWTRGSANQVPYEWHGMKTLAATGTAPLWTGLLDTLNPMISGGIVNMEIFDDRQNVNNPSMASFHAYGLAADVNAPYNPNGTSNVGKSGQYVIPYPGALDVAARYGMEWLYDADPMHFEIHVSPSQIGADGAITLGSAGSFGATAGLNTVDPIVDFGVMNMARGTAEQVGALPPGDAIERWRPLYTTAIAMLGSSVNIDNMLHQMMTESSGDPLSYAIDSNYFQGHPSKSLLQMIPRTFRDNAAPGYSTNIWDPLSNALSSLNYVAKNYGSVYPGVAYDNSGWLMPGGVGVNLRKQPEPVLTPQMWDTAERALASVSRTGGQPIVMHVYQQPGQSAADLAREMNRQLVWVGA
jgi:hypothetical protein